MEEIQFKNVSFSYPPCEKKSLKDINFSINKGEFILVCGKSGCGKSTLLRHLKKNLMPYGELEGSILYYGNKIQELDDRVSASEIGYVQQSPDNQIVTDKVWHELAFGLESLGYDNNSIKVRVAEIANYFGIQTWFRKDINELSGGQKQLLNLASIMAMQPKLLILDEPTSQLDPIAASDFLRTIQKLNNELGTTIIISEHRLEEVFSMADKVIVMEKGKIIKYDTPKNVGDFLSKIDKKHEMYYGLPSVMKIYSELNSFGECPLNIKEGRLWLEKILPNEEKTVEKKSIKPKKRKKEKGFIHIEDIYFRYSKKSMDIIKSLSLDINEGEWYCLLGGNGVGKSTTLKVLSQINKPYRGKVLIDGLDIFKCNAKEFNKKNIVMLPQNPQSLFTEITVEEELFEALFYIKINDEEKKIKVNNVLKLLELDELRQSNPYDLSGGEQQRLALGKILLLEPKILLLDEPTKGLDPFLKKNLGDLMKKLQEEGITIFMVSHDIEFCAEYADRCGLFFDGNIVAEDRTKEFFSGNSFYTTAANKLVKKWFPDAITYKEVVELCKEVTI